MTDETDENNLRYFGYRVYLPEKGLRPLSSFTKDEKEMLRPIAEVLAMLDGNAFFGATTDENGNDTWYEMYVPEAYVAFKSNGGYQGWSGSASFMQDKVRNRRG